MTSAKAVELLGNRVLEGPNLYFPRPAMKVTLDVAALLDAPSAEIRAMFQALRARSPRIGEPSSAQREQAVMRLVEVVTRRVARACGTTRLGVRVRAGEEPTHLIVAFPWNRRERGRALGRAVAAALSDLTGGDREGAVERAADTVRATPSGPRETMPRPKVPVISITGTNGKTTTTRLVAHIAMTAGRKTAWSSTDGVLVMGDHVEHGDYSGPSGARTVLATPGLEVAVLETARGGLLNRGMGVPCNDVSVVTNVSPDHLGQNGIDTVDQLAEVKAIITKVTKPGGWCVLNGDDPRVWAMRVGTTAQVACFTLDPQAPCIREALAAHGKAYTVVDGHLVCLDAHGMDSLISLDDVPMTLGGLSSHNIANALAGAAGALALGMPRIAVVEGLRTFMPDARLNPGRMNIYTLPLGAATGEDARTGSVTVIVDMAHNEAGLEALLAVARGLVAPGGSLRLGLGTGGDRTDEILVSMGEMAARGADVVQIVHKEHYLRGRTMAELESLLRTGLEHVGVTATASWENELDGLTGLLLEAQDGDVLAEMVHSDQAALHTWLMEHGGAVDDGTAIRGKVRAARGSADRHPDLNDDTRRLLDTAITTLREAAQAGATSATVVEALDLLTALPHGGGPSGADLREFLGVRGDVVQD